MVAPNEVTPHKVTPRRSLRDRCQAIELLVVDVDGVLTAGGIQYGDGGVESKAFHVRDGAGLKLWRQAGKRAALITGRSSEVVARRARELGIDPAIQGAGEKLPAYRELLRAGPWCDDQVCYVGDDVPDVPLLARCGLAVAVADGCGEARARAHYVTAAAGGRGAVREVIELILRCQGGWQEALARPEAAPAGA
jgi:3-deoxy-D-manno-octulosonate 8-phosphate phosphatase (KDO 8-P phosphatase)